MDSTGPHPLKALATLLGGGAVGGLIYGVQFSLYMLTKATLSDVDAGTVIAMLILPPLFLALFTVPAFVIGMALVGWPVWYAMDWLGWRAAWQGAIAGGLGAGLTGAALVATVVPYGSLMTFGWLVIPGAVAGLVGWRMIYPGLIRPLRPSPAQPS